MNLKGKVLVFLLIGSIILGTIGVFAVDHLSQARVSTEI